MLKIKLSYQREVINLYRESHRFYHTHHHIFEMLNFYKSKRKTSNITQEEYEMLTCFAVFHDAVCIPGNKDNEEKSVELFNSYLIGKTPESDLIERLILRTKEHKWVEESEAFAYPNEAKLTNLAIESDLLIFKKGMKDLIQYEEQIFKEYQFVNIDEYIDNRCLFLAEFAVNVLSNLDYTFYIHDVDSLIGYIKNKKYRIGIYPGSFNPFHVGHLNVVSKAEKLFDKVILAQGINPDKSNLRVDLPKSLNNEKIYYNGFVSALFKPSKYNVQYFMIRGLRNEHDVAYEENLREWVHELNAEIEFCYLFCDKEFEKVSSSTLRGLSQTNKEFAERYIVK